MEKLDGTTGASNKDNFKLLKFACGCVQRFQQFWTYQEFLFQTVPLLQIFCKIKNPLFQLYLSFKYFPKLNDSKLDWYVVHFVIDKYSIENSS